MRVPFAFAVYSARSKSSLLAAAMFAGAFGVGLAPAADGDLWWHLAAGRQIASTGSLLRTDPFSVSAAGRPWVDVHWLFQVAAYGVYCIGGLTAIVLAKCLLVASGAVIQLAAVQREAGRRGGALFTVVFLGAMFMCRELLLVRPVVVTLVFISLFFLLLERFRRDGRSSVLLPLGLVQIAWCNCQGLFVLGPSLVAAYAVGCWAEARFGGRRWFPFLGRSFESAKWVGGHPPVRSVDPVPAELQTCTPGVDHAPAKPETYTPGVDHAPAMPGTCTPGVDHAPAEPETCTPGVDHAPAEPETCRRGLAIALLFCVLACFVTPYGVHALALPITLFHRLIPTGGNVYAANIAENVSPFAMGHSAATQFWHLRWFLGLLAASLLIARRRLSLTHALVVAALVVLALMANRNVLLLYWLATPIAVMNLGPALRRLGAALRAGRARRQAQWAFRGALVALLAIVAAAAAREPAIASPAPFRAPIEGTQFIADRPGSGTIFAADEYGGYLIWELFPRYRPYMDTRQVLRTPSEFADYLALADHPERFDELARRQAFDYVVLPVGYPDRYLDLIRHLYSSSAWKLVFTNGAETVFASALPERGQNDDGTSPASPERGQNDDNRWDLGLARTTDRVLAAIDRRYGASPRIRDAARLQFATLESTLGNFDEGDRILQSMAPSAEADAWGARSRLASGDLTEAQRLGNRVLEKDADDVRSLNLMAMVSLRRGEPRRALDFLRRAIAVDPFDAETGRILSTLEKREHGQPHRE